MNDSSNETVYTDLVTIVVRYHNPNTNTVQIVWGVDGWRLLPQSVWPENTQLGEIGGMSTPMIREDGVFTVRIQIPRGSRFNYGFRTDDAWETISNCNAVTQICPKENAAQNESPVLARFGVDRLLESISIWRRYQKYSIWDKEYTPFIILGQGRTGSTYLIGLLSSHPKIATYSELFHNDELERIRLNYPIGAIMPGMDPGEYLHNRIFKDFPPEIKAVGFKIFYGHARTHWKSTWAYLRKIKVRVIHLKRSNYLDRHLSEQLASRSNLWSSLQKVDGVNYNTPIVLDPETCLNNFWDYENKQKFSDKFFARNPMLNVYYEDLVSNFEAETRRILDFLGVEFQPLLSNFQKQRKLAKSVVIENHDELKEYIGKAMVNHPFKQKWLGFFDETDRN